MRLVRVVAAASGPLDAQPRSAIQRTGRASSSAGPKFHPRPAHPARSASSR